MCSSYGWLGWLILCIFERNISNKSEGNPDNIDYTLKYLLEHTVRAFISEVKKKQKKKI